MKAKDAKTSYLPKSIRTPAVWSMLWTPWWVWIAGLDILFILMTILVPYLPGRLVRIAQHFDLAVELNLGALWSTINLILLALLAYGCFSTTRPQQLLKKYAWLILTIVLWLLALDEIGSLHERMGGFRRLAPYIVVFAILLIGSIGVLLLSKDTRKVAIFLVLMFGLFGGAVLQEYFEHLISWPGWAHGIRNGLEEGSELLGMLLGIIGFASLRQNQKDSSLRSILPDFDTFDHLPAFWAGGLIFHGIVSAAAAYMLKGNGTGNPVLFFPVFSLTMLLLVGLRRLFEQPTKDVSGILLTAFSVIGLLISVYLVVPRQETSQLSASVLSTGFPVASGVLLVLGALLYQMTNPGGVRKNPRVLLLPALALMSTWVMPGLFVRYIAAGVFSWAFFYLFLLQGWRTQTKPRHGLES